jgi:hypothetical protein
MTRSGSRYCHTQGGSQARDRCRNRFVLRRTATTQSSTRLRTRSSLTESSSQEARPTLRWTGKRRRCCMPSTSRQTVPARPGASRRSREPSHNGSRRSTTGRGAKDETDHHPSRSARASGLLAGRASRGAGLGPRAYARASRVRPVLGALRCGRCCGKHDVHADTLHSRRFQDT